jgi:hypothetical protein
MSITGFPEHRPVRSGMALTDLCDGLLPGQRLLCVDRAGTVRRGPMGLHGATRSSDLHARFPARYLINGDVAKPAGNDHPAVFPRACSNRRRQDQHLRRLRGAAALLLRVNAFLRAPQALMKPKIYRLSQEASPLASEPHRRLPRTACFAPHSRPTGHCTSQRASASATLTRSLTGQ